jgi:hypothetical protein
MGQREQQTHPINIAPNSVPEGQIVSRSDFVTLRAGLALPLAAVRLALDLEARGLHLGVNGDMLWVGPRDLLTDDDRELIRRWKPHLLAIVAYDAAANGRTQ